MNLLTIFVVGLMILGVLTTVVGVMSMNELKASPVGEDHVKKLKKYNTLLVVYGVLATLMTIFVLVMRSGTKIPKGFRF